MRPSPNQPPLPIEVATQPVDTGKLLEAFPRNKGREELRVTLSEFNGHQFVSLRVWERDFKGKFWPTKRGVSVRLAEAEGVCVALAKALSLSECEV
jgi:hypothetical protein